MVHVHYHLQGLTIEKSLEQAEVAEEGISNLIALSQNMRKTRTYFS